jgi:uncharacterized OB-fold protein
MTPRPVPTLRGEEALYFAAARDGRLVYQSCRDCGAVVWHPRVVCPRCLAAELDLRDSAGKGTVYSFTVLHRAGHPAFAQLVPYVIVLVDLDEGFRVLADLVDGEQAGVRVGMRVEVLFTPVTEDFTVPSFRSSEGRS